MIVHGTPSNVAREWSMSHAQITIKEVSYGLIGIRVFPRIITEGEKSERTKNMACARRYCRSSSQGNGKDVTTSTAAPSNPYKRVPKSVVHLISVDLEPIVDGMEHEEAVPIDRLIEAI